MRLVTVHKVHTCGYCHNDIEPGAKCAQTAGSRTTYGDTRYFYYHLGCGAEKYGLRPFVTMLWGSENKARARRKLEPMGLEEFIRLNNPYKK